MSSPNGEQPNQFEVDILQYESSILTVGSFNRNKAMINAINIIATLADFLDQNSVK